SVGMPELYFDRFLKAGYDEVLVLSRGKVVTELAQIEGCELIKNKALRFGVRISGKYLNLLSPVTLLGICKEVLRGDLVVINTPSIVGLVAVALSYILKRPYVVELAADLNMFESKKFGFFVSAFHKKMIPFFIKRAVGVAYVSKHLAEMYPAGG